MKYISVALCCTFACGNASAQTILPELDTNFTLTLSGATPQSETGSMTVVIRRKAGENDRKTYITFYSDRVESNGLTVAQNLPSWFGTGNYTFVRSGSTLSIYHNNLLLCNAGSETTGSIPFVTAYADEPFEYSLIDGGEAAALGIISTTEAIKPDPLAAETNTANMLIGGTNIVKDPYMSGGFKSETTSTGRVFISNAALLEGWGNNAAITQDAYSGPYSVKLWGQAFSNGAATTGASLSIPASMSAGTTYLVRAMVKSEGYVGRIGMTSESGYIPITDTNGEWVQVEGLLTPKSARTALIVNNADYVNDGTLYIDNVEVYAKTNFSTPRTMLPYASLNANVVSKYAYADATAYMLGFTLNGAQSSQLDPTGLNYLGATSLTIKAKGSVLYPIYFPGTLNGAYITGTYDGYTFTGLNGVHGLDYVLYRYNAPYFETVPTDKPVPGGAYLLQFVDNLENASVTLITGVKDHIQGDVTSKYALRGNDTYRLFTPEGQFLRYNQTEGRFVLTADEELAPFEAYIATTEVLPVNTIYPALTATALQGIKSDNGTRISVIAGKGHINIYADGEAQLHIYSINGSIVAAPYVSKGETAVSLPAGIYIVGGKKVIVL